MFLLIDGVDRAEAEHVLVSFFAIGKYDEHYHGGPRTKRLVLGAEDRVVGR